LKKQKGVGQNMPAYISASIINDVLQATAARAINHVLAIVQ